MKPLTEIISNLTTKSRLVIFILLLATFWILPTFWFKGVLSGISIGFIFLILVWLTRNAWLPEERIKKSIRYTILSIVSGTALTYGSWSNWLNGIAKDTLWHFLRNWADVNLTRSDLFGEAARALPKDLPGEPAPAIVFAFVLVGIYLVLKSLKSTQPMGKHSAGWKAQFPERDFQEKLANICLLLRRHLERINEDTKWSDLWFTPLDAEVELENDGGRRVVLNLLKALRNSTNARTFLILGEPGSGKSVALRKLATDLLHDVQQTGKLPLYVNLREWCCLPDWSEANPPTVKQVTHELQKFVRDSLNDQLDIYGSEFWKEYYDPLCQNGRLFFILDSFDEIAILLDHAEGTRLLESIAAGIHAFLEGEHESRGVLASRLFRRPPSFAFRADVTLEIRPLSNSKVFALFEKRLRAPKDSVRKALAARTDLMLAATNPFTAALLAEFINSANSSGASDILPSSQVTLYSRYIESRLSQAGDRFAQFGISKQSSVLLARELAKFMYSGSPTGLEVSVSDFRRVCNIQPFDKIIDGLCFARILRGSGTLKRTVSFVHRRFAEFFMVEEILTNPALARLDWILSDSRLREVLVLYCEVAPEGEIGLIADACWRTVESVDAADANNPAILRHGVYALRFLVDGFRCRSGYLRSRIPTLSGHLIKIIQDEKAELLRRKLAIEATDLLSEEDMVDSLIAALNSESRWLTEVAFASCRKVANGSDQLAAAIDSLLLRRAWWFVWDNYFQWSEAAQLGFVNRRVLSCLRFAMGDIMLLIFGFICLLIDFVCNPRESIWLLVLIPFALFVPEPGFERGSSGARMGIILILFVVNLVAWFVGLILFSINITLYSKIYSGQSTHQFGHTPISFFFVEFLFVPWFALVFSTVARNKLKAKYSHKYLWMGYVIAIASISICAFLGSKFKAFAFVEDCLLVLIATVIILAVLIGLYIYFLKYISDRRLYWQFISSDVTTRKQIHDSWHSFKTDRFRLRYVRWIKQRAFVVGGMWPDGVCPGKPGNPASEALVQLDEKWLGLER